MATTAQPVVQQKVNGVEQPTPAEKQPVVKPFDSYFSVEYQGMLALKYREKYSAVEQEAHLKYWPEFAGNHCTLYILAESTSEARKKVYSLNRVTITNSLIAAMASYTPTTPGAVLTELQVAFNRTTSLQLNALKEQVADTEQRTDMLKAYAKNLKTTAKSGKDLDGFKAKFFYACGEFGVAATSIW